MAVDAAPPVLEQDRVVPARAARALAARNAAQAQSVTVEAQALPPRVLAAWLRMWSLLLGCAAGGVAVGAARWGERSWLSAVFCGCVAAVVTAAAGFILSRVMLTHCDMHARQPDQK